MKCPFCRQTKTEVYNTRTTKSANQTWRRRRCLKCGKLFTTYEASDLTFLRILPRTGRPQPYSRAQLFASLYDAFLDVPHKAATIDAVTDTIEAKLLDLQQQRLTAGQVADLTLTTLKHFNTAAFLRYLSAHTSLLPTDNLRQALRKY